MAADHETLLTVFKDHTGLVNTLWGIFQAITLGFLSYVYTQAEVRRSVGVLLGLSLLFAVFAYGNRASILRSQAVLYAVHQQFHDDAFAKNAPPGVVPVLRAHVARSVDETGRGHLATTAAVIIAAWLPFLVALRRTH